MPLHSPSTPPPPLTQHLAPGQGNWICLAPGSTLRTTRGEVAVHWPPQDCGQASQTPPPPTVLKAGQHLPWSGQAQAVWIQLHNPWHRPAEIQLMEATPAPGLWQTIWCGLRAALQSPRKAAKDSDHGGALHAAR
ncbi:hypothetical protein [Acidovorax sp. Q11]